MSDRRIRAALKSAAPLERLFALQRRPMLFGGPPRAPSEQAGGRRRPSYRR